jgi:hypothetical protein
VATNRSSSSSPRTAACNCDAGLRIRRTACEHRTSEEATPPRDSAHHGSDRHADDLGDLVVLEAIDVVQLDGRCEIFWKLRQRRAHFFTRQPRGDFIEQEIRIAADQFLVGRFQPRDGDELASSRGAFSSLAQHRAQDSIEPCANAGRVAKLVEVRPCAYARFLNRIFRIRPDIAPPRREREETVQVREHQGVESRLPIGELLLVE